MTYTYYLESYIHRIHLVLMSSSDWKRTAADKRDSVLALIPEEWRISSIPSASEQPNVTGEFIRKYLNEEEIEITETDAAGIVQNISSGKWSCVSVTKAFCHRAAISHQLVCFRSTRRTDTCCFRALICFTGQLPS